MHDQKPLHPGQLLKLGYLEPLGISPWELAKALGVQVGRITSLIKGKRSLTPDTAARLGAYFQVPALWFLEAQARWDAQRLASDPALTAHVVPCARLANVIVTPKGVVHAPRARTVRPLAPLMVSLTEAPEPKPTGEVRVVINPDGTTALEHR